MACDVSPVAMFLYHDVDTEDDDDFFLLCQDDDDVDEVEEWVEFQFALSGGENDKKKVLMPISLKIPLCYQPLVRGPPRILQSWFASSPLPLHPSLARCTSWLALPSSDNGDGGGLSL